MTSRDAKSSGRKQTRLSSLLPALQQLWMSDLHWQLPSQGCQTHRPPRPVRDSMLAELGHGCIGRKSLSPELLPRTAEEKAGMPAMWETLTCYVRLWGNLQGNDIKDHKRTEPCPTSAGFTESLETLHEKLYTCSSYCHPGSRSFTFLAVLTKKKKLIKTT